MNIHIEGTEETQELIKNIIKHFRAQKPETLHVDYEIAIGTDVSFSTEENENVMRNVSIIRLKGLYVAIGNRTGDLLVRRKPLLMSKRAILRKITRFLRSIQPERLAKSKKITMDSFSDSSIFGPAPELTRATQTYKFGWIKIQKSIKGSNQKTDTEYFDEYKVL